MTQSHPIQRRIRRSLFGKINPEGTLKNTLRVFAEYFAIRKMKIISKGETKFNPLYKPKKIIFNRVYTRFTKLIIIEIAIAKVLQIIGHEVLFLICDRAMTRCSTVFTCKNEPLSICDNCISFGKKILTAANIPYIQYSSSELVSSFLEQGEKEFEKCVYNSVERYYKGITDRKNKSEVEENYRTNACLSHAMAQLSLKEFKPDVIFSNHQAYAEWNPFYEYAKEHGVRYVTWNISFGENKIILDLDDVGKRFDKDGYLTIEKEKEIDKYLSLRRKGKTDTWLYGKNPIKKDNDGIYFGMFLNVPWDSGLVNSNKVFDSVYEWVDQTLEFFKHRPDLTLLVKIHPAEKIDGSYETMKDYILKNHILMENIKIIDTDVNAYSMFDIIDVGLTYTGTTGIELATIGKPVIVSGDIFYSGKGFTYDVESKEDYIRKLSWVKNSLEDMKPDEDQIRTAKSFAHFYMLESTIPIEFLYNSVLGWKYTIKDFSRLIFDRNMMKIIRYIIGE